MAIQLLTKAPLATNLRLVTVAMKISQNLERIGDEATKIAKRARDLARNRPSKSTSTCRAWPASRSTWSRTRSTRLCSAIPPPPAPSSRATRKWTRSTSKSTTQLAQHMMENPDTIARCLHWIVAAKSLERIADHAKNIAEEVVYLCEAQDIRHTGAKNPVVPA